MTVSTLKGRLEQFNHIITEQFIHDMAKNVKRAKFDLWTLQTYEISHQ